MPGKQGLLHISEISWKRLETMDGCVQRRRYGKGKTGRIGSENRKIQIEPKGIASQT